MAAPAPRPTDVVAAAARAGLTRRRLLLAGAGLQLSSLAAAQPGRVPTVTRLVRNFLDLESSLLDAQHRGDRAALEQLLAPDFELRVARRPGTPVPRAEWLDAVLRPPLPAGQFVIEQMAVHEHTGAMVASFLLRPEHAEGRGAPTLFIVDAWVRAGERWTLATRYAAPVPKDAPRVPGDADTPTLRKRE